MYTVLRKPRTKNDYCSYEESDLVAFCTVSIGGYQVFLDWLILRIKTRLFFFEVIYQSARRHISE